MIRRSTWILLLIFVVILTVTVYIQTREDGSGVEMTPTSEADLPFVLIPEGEEIIGLWIMNDSGGVVELNRLNINNGWTLENHDNGLVDNDRIISTLSRLESVTIKAEMEDDTPLDVIGLASPAYTITLKISQGNQINIHIGDVTITEDSYYSQINPGPALVVTKSGLDGVINFLEDPPILMPTSTSIPTTTQTPQP